MAALERSVVSCCGPDTCRQQTCRSPRNTTGNTRNVAGTQLGDNKHLSCATEDLAQSTLFAGVTGVFHVAERQKHEADKPLPFCSGIQAAWSPTAMPSHAVKSWCVVMHGYTAYVTCCELKRFCVC